MLSSTSLVSSSRKFRIKFGVECSLLPRSSSKSAVLLLTFPLVYIRVQCSFHEVPSIRFSLPQLPLDPPSSPSLLKLSIRQVPYYVPTRSLDYQTSPLDQQHPPIPFPTKVPTSLSTSRLLHNRQPHPLRLPLSFPHPTLAGQ